MKAKYIAAVAAGIAIALAAIWWGCWYNNAVGGIVAWQSFPIFCTSCIGFCAGAGLAGYGVCKMLL